MSLYSKQKLFCNCCGIEMFVEYHGIKIMGSKFKVCSRVCLREISWRETLSIMGKEYYPDPEPHKEEN